MYLEVPTFEATTLKLREALGKQAFLVLRTHTLRLPPLRLQPSNLGRPLGVGLSCFEGLHPKAPTLEAATLKFGEAFGSGPLLFEGLHPKAPTLEAATLKFGEALSEQAFLTS
jgi:hypothetical protein